MTQKEYYGYAKLKLIWDDRFYSSHYVLIHQKILKSVLIIMLLHAHGTPFTHPFFLYLKPYVMHDSYHFDEKKLLQGCLEKTRIILTN